MNLYAIYLGGKLYGLKEGTTARTIFEHVRRFIRPGVSIRIVEAYTLESFEGIA